MRRRAIVLLALLGFPGIAIAQQNRVQCDPDNGGLKLPAGFCATVFADTVRGARHIVVAPNGDVFVAVRGSRNQPGGLVSLRDRNGDGKADVQVRISVTGGTGIALRGNQLYFGADNAVLRYNVGRSATSNAGGPDTIVRDLPLGGHTAKSIA